MTSKKYSYPGELGLQPDEVHAQQQGAERLPVASLGSTMATSLHDQLPTVGCLSVGGRPSPGGEGGV